MRGVVTILAMLALWGCAPASGDGAAAQREVVAGACRDGRLAAMGMTLDPAGCACAANQLQAQMSPAAMATLEAYAAERRETFDRLRADLAAEERALLDPIGNGAGLARAVADCL